MEATPCLGTAGFQAGGSDPEGPAEVWRPSPKPITDGSCSKPQLEDAQTGNQNVIAAGREGQARKNGANLG